MRARRPLRGSRGFTLLEVMVALAILAGGLLAVSQLTSAALQNHGRAVRLEVATLLARGKLAALRDKWDKDGFRDFDEEAEGSFDADGHPDVKWKLHVVKPKVELGPDQILATLLGTVGKEGAGGFDLASLFGGQAQGAQQGGGSGDSTSKLGTAFPGAAALVGPMRSQLGVLGEQMKKGLREIRLTVSWPEGARSESFTVVTHVLAYGKGVVE